MRAEKLWAARLREHLPFAPSSPAPPRDPLGGSLSKLPEMLPGGRAFRRKLEPALVALRRLTPMVEHSAVSFGGAGLASEKSVAEGVHRARGEIELRR